MTKQEEPSAASGSSETQQRRRQITRYKKYDNFTRYQHVDLCDVLSSFSYGAKVKLDELSRIMGLPGKPDGIDGSQVEGYFKAGRIQEIADQIRRDQHLSALIEARAISRAIGSEPV